jgi:MFS family permease
MRKTPTFYSLDNNDKDARPAVIDETAPLVSPLNTPLSTKMTSIPPFVVKATAIASLGGILFGYDMGVISGALPLLTTAFSLSQNQQQLVVGILYLGGGVGAAIGGTLCDAMGRKTAILLTDVSFLFGAALLSLATSVEMLIVGRIVMGLAIAISGIADVAYLNELAPKEWRGSIVSVNEACISLGFLLAYVAGYVFSSSVNGWRYMFGVSGLVALFQLLGMIISMPESPLWLQEQGRRQEAHDALKIIYGGREECIPAMDTDHEQDAQHLVIKNVSSTTYEHISPPKNGDSSSYWNWACRGHCRLLIRTLRRHSKQAWIALFLSVAQQLTGQTIVLNYAPLIFGQFNPEAAISSTLWIGIVKFITTVIVIWRIEYVGRRNLLLLGMTVICIGLCMLTLAFSLGSEEIVNGEMVPSNTEGGMLLALPGVLLVVVGYSASFGPLTWLLTSELFPTDIRGRALGISTIVTYLCACLATSTFLTAQAWFGGFVFLVNAALTFLGCVFSYLAIPDTAGKTVGEIEQELASMWWWRRDNYNDVVHASIHSNSDSSDRPILLEAEMT